MNGTQLAEKDIHTFESTPVLCSVCTVCMKTLKRERPRKDSTLIYSGEKSPVARRIILKWVYVLGYSEARAYFFGYISVFRLSTSITNFYRQLYVQSLGIGFWLIALKPLEINFNSLFPNLSPGLMFVEIGELYSLSLCHRGYYNTIQYASH